MMSKLIDAVNLNQYMDLYEYQRSSSFIDLGPRSLTLVQCHSDSTFSNFFSSETARQIEAKFYVEPQWDGLTKVYSNGPGHNTSMAAIPIYGKNMKNYSSLEPEGRWPWKFVLKYYHVCSNDDPGWPWPILRQGQMWSPMLMYGKKLKRWIFQKLL